MHAIEPKTILKAPEARSASARLSSARVLTVDDHAAAVGFLPRVDILRRSDAVTLAMRHGLFWMLAANAVGVWLATLLLWPELQAWMSPLTYGRWVPVHLNLHLYGWTSIPLLGWLMRLYRVEQSPGRDWIRSAYCVWSMALVLGTGSWLMGHSSGKVFLDWTGYTRIVLPCAMIWTWVLLVLGWKHEARAETPRNWRWLSKGLGLGLLFAVAPVWYWSAGREIYPSVNPHSGGPTGASLLGSTLIVILVLLLLPATLGVPKKRTHRHARAVWFTYVLEWILYALLDHSHTSHTNPDQILGLGSLLVWAILLPWYYAAFSWPKTSVPWQRAFLAWLILLLLTGWASFLPGLLDHLKFTDGLVAHSHLAMAGFITSFNLFLLSVLAHGTGCKHALAHKQAYWMWNTGTLAYLILMWLAGWLEGARPDFTMAPTWGRHGIYGLRLACGGLMLASSILWWRGTRAPGRFRSGSNL